MSYDSIEQSTADGQPWEIYLFETEGVSFRLTSADQTISYLGQDYVPTTIHRTELEHTHEVISGQIKVYLPPAHAIARLFVPYMPPTPMSITIWGGHYGDSDVIVLFKGQISSSLFTDECELTCSSSLYIMQRQIPKKLQQMNCAHVFGDSRCTMNLELFTTFGTIAAVNATGDQLTVVAFGSVPHSLKAGYLVRGNDARMIVDHTGDVVTLLAPIPGLQVGDSVSGVAGCQHTYGACQAYGNTDNFLGFDLIPTINPFSGSIA
jgi:hypothetical protein